MNGRLVLRGRLVVALLLAALLIFQMAFPGPALARGFLKDLFGFVFKLPDKLTRWMGPMAPIGRMWLFGKFPKAGRLFKAADRIKSVGGDVKARRKHVAEAKAVYREQASEYRKQAEQIRTNRKKIRSIIGDCGQGSLRVFMDEYLRLEKMAVSLEAAAQKLENRADSLDAGDILRMFGRGLLRDTLRDMGRVRIGNVAQELAGLQDSRLVSGLVEKGSINVEDVVNAIISKDVDQLAKAKGLGDLDPNVKRQVVSHIKNRIDRKGEHLKKNWGKELDKSLAAVMERDSDEIETELKDIPDDLDDLNVRTGCGEDDTEPLVTRPPPKTKIPRNMDVALSLSTDPDSYDSGLSVELKSDSVNLKVGNDGLVTGHAFIVYALSTGYLETEGVDGDYVQEEAVLRPKEDSKPLEDYPGPFTLSAKVTRHTFVGGKLRDSETVDVKDYLYGTFVSPTDANGSLSIGERGALLTWKAEEYSQSARMR